MNFNRWSFSLACNQLADRVGRVFSQYFGLSIRYRLPSCPFVVSGALVVHLHRTMFRVADLLLQRAPLRLTADQSSCILRSLNLQASQFLHCQPISFGTLRGSLFSTRLMGWSWQYRWSTVDSFLCRRVGEFTLEIRLTHTLMAIKGIPLE